MDPIYETRYWAKVDKSGDCWLWTASKNFEGGYGVFRMGDQKRLHYAHRLSYEMAYGPIPPGLDVCHKCDNPRCVNPAHLMIGTRRFNVADMKAKGRQRNGISRGSANGCAKLTEDQVAEIVSRYGSERIGQRRLASEYGVSRNVIRQIARGEKWRHVTHGATVKGNARTPALNPSEATSTRR